MADPHAVDDVEAGYAFGQGVTDHYGQFGFGVALVFAQFDQPAVAPVFGAFGFPQDAAGSVACSAIHTLYQIAAEFAFGDRFDAVEREFAAQQVFQFQFLHFTLQLLRALFGFLFEFFNFLLHGEDGLVFFHHPQFQAFFGFAFSLIAYFVKTGLHAFFHGQFQFAFGVVQLALFFDQFGLGLLGFGEFGVADFQYLV